MLYYPFLCFHLINIRYYQVQYPAIINYLLLPITLSAPLFNIMVHLVILYIEILQNYNFSNEYEFSYHHVPCSIECLQIKHL